MTPMETTMLLIGVATVVDRLMRLIEYLDGGTYGRKNDNQRTVRGRTAER